MGWGRVECSGRGPRQDVKPRLRFGPVDAMRLCRNIRLLIDNGRRTISEASFGSEPKPLHPHLGVATFGRQLKHGEQRGSKSQGFLTGAENPGYGRGWMISQGLGCVGLA